MSFGLSASGFNPKRLDDVRTDLIEAFRARFGQNVQVHDRSVNGQIIGIFAERYADLWEFLELVYKAAYPDSADGVSLDDLLVLAAVARALATYSTVTLTLGGTNGTLIQTGSISKDADGIRWVHQADATIAGGTASVVARAEATGPITGLAGTITSIDTPVSGWTTVTNALDAVVGRNAMSDSEARELYNLTIRASGVATEGMRAAILRIADVIECEVIENEAAYPDADGRPAKSFETVVRGGLDQSIVDTIWLFKPAGIETFGSTTGTATDVAGDAHSIKFSRPVEVDIYMIVDWLAQPNVLTSEKDGIEDAIVTALLELGGAFTIGRDVVPFEFIQHIETIGIRSLSIRVGLAPNPASTSPLDISRTELAVFDSSRISFVRL